MRIVVSGGGSAGHITPTLAVCAALTSHDSATQLLYIGQAASMEERMVTAAKLPFAPISAGKLRRNWRSPLAMAQNVRDIFRFVAGFFQSLGILRHFRPDVIFLKGGFVCMPVGFAARVLRIPYVVHESDIHPGLTNRLLGRHASRVAVGFPVKYYHDFDPDKLVFTGSPVRPELLGAHRLEGLAEFGLDNDLPVILVTGGSQGARQVNDVVLAALPKLLPHYQIIHQTGDGEINRIKFELGRAKPPHLERYHPVAFLLGEMPAALAVADLVVARAGAQTIAEVAILGKPTVLIPNYQAAAHQQENARVLARAGAARVLDGAKLTPDRLVGEIEGIASDEAARTALEQGIRGFGRPNAAHELAGLITAAAKEGGRG